jgi:F-type H+-transporting ATPase subunit b
MNIIPDLGLLLMQTIPFVVTLIALHFILFKPMLAYLEERDAAIEGVKEEAQKLQARIDSDVALWEGKLAAARSEVAQERSRLHEAAQAQRKRLIDEARVQAEARVGSAVAEIQEARKAATTTIRSTSLALARLIAERVLDRPVGEA